MNIHIALLMRVLSGINSFNAIIIMIRIYIIL